MSKFYEWVGKNTVRIPAAVTALIGFLLAFGFVDWTTTQIGAIMGLLAAVLVFFTGVTVTANVRLGDDGGMFGGLTGKEV